MRGVSGIYVNNCIPLCRSCNASKGKRDFREFFSDDELIEVIERSQSINAEVNQHMAHFDDPCARFGSKKKAADEGTPSESQNRCAHPFDRMRGGHLLKPDTLQVTVRRDPEDPPPRLEKALRAR